MDFIEQLSLYQSVTLVIGALGMMVLLTSLIFDFETDIGDAFDVFDFFPLKAVIAFVASCASMLFVMSFSDGSFLFGIILSIVVSLVIAGVVLWLVKFLNSHEGQDLTDEDLVGVEGTLALGIPEGGRGRVSCMYRGHLVSRIAVSEQALEKDAPVWVSGVRSLGIVEVTPVE